MQIHPNSIIDTALIIKVADPFLLFIFHNQGRILLDLFDSFSYAGGSERFWVLFLFFSFYLVLLHLFGQQIVEESNRRF